MAYKIYTLLSELESPYLKEPPFPGIKQNGNE